METKPPLRTPAAPSEPTVSTLSYDSMERHIIEAVTPSIDCGRYPVKRIVGDPCIVEADIFRDGHAIIRAVIKWRHKDETDFAESPMIPLDNDRWRGSFPLNENTRYVFTIEAWTDTYATWAADFIKKATAGRNVAADLEEGIALLRHHAHHAPASERQLIVRTADQFNAFLRTDPSQAASTVNNSALLDRLIRFGERSEATTYSTLFEIIADRPKARFSSWYEMFPRSQGTTPGRPSTLREAEQRLPAIRAMGFDVLYLPPIHPIGLTNRKGPNNSITANESSPGSP